MSRQATGARSPERTSIAIDVPSCLDRHSVLGANLCLSTFVFELERPSQFLSSRSSAHSIDRKWCHADVVISSRWKSERRAFVAAHRAAASAAQHVTVGVRTPADDERRERDRCLVRARA
jgi:hypothetical protein